MNVDEYPSNSNKSKQEKKVEKIVTSNVKKKKRNSFGDFFLSDDANNVKDFIIVDVIVPASKKIITDIVRNLSDIIVNGMDALLYGDGWVDRSSRRNGPSERVSYRNYYDRNNSRGARVETRPMSQRYSYDDLLFDSKGEAEDVLGHMYDLIDQYGTASIADLYDLVGVTGNYTDNKYGWMDLKGSRVTRTRDGYLLKLPVAMPLD